LRSAWKRDGLPANWSNQRVFIGLVYQTDIKKAPGTYRYSGKRITIVRNLFFEVGALVGRTETSRTGLCGLVSPPDTKKAPDQHRHSGKRAALIRNPFLNRDLSENCPKIERGIVRHIHVPHPYDRLTPVFGASAARCPNSLPANLSKQRIQICLSFSQT
jgi:hypothetical protein